MHWNLSDLSLYDIEQIHTIEEISFKAPWSRTLFLEELACKTASDYVVKLAGSEKHEPVIAYICSRIIGCELSILRIAVSPEWRNMGIASWLLDKCFKMARDKGVTSVFLEVRESNSAAIALYGKLGFISVGKRPAYYPETGEDAVVLMKKLT
ncbi:MAG: ribosomal protein S18-alanine N-acetyltransferase [Desulfobacterales bacterium]|nr:ribosomal protein S18-alanine N-acetyltransferase [Desulfobacterales bacterium]